MKTLPTETAVELWFQDEMRVGQKNGLVYQGAKKEAARASRPINAMRALICSARSVPPAIPAPPW